jgi:hypothetical protein
LLESTPLLDGEYTAPCWREDRSLLLKNSFVDFEEGWSHCNPYKTLTFRPYQHFHPFTMAV